jgi:MOSC domain-containing protein YiiM
VKTGRIVAISISDRKGERKHNVQEASLIKDRGLEHDAHAEGGMRQVSLLMDESIERMQSQGVDVAHGDFAENIVTKGLDLSALKLDDIIRVGEKGKLKVTMIGKECVAPCRIYYQVGYCIMPQEGVFCIVLEPDRIKVGDSIILEGS